MRRSLRINYQAGSYMQPRKRKINNQEQNTNWNLKQPQKNVSCSGRLLIFETLATAPSNP